MIAWICQSSVKKFAASLALAAVALLTFSQALSSKHMIASVVALDAGEVLVCTQFGPLKLNMDLGLPVQEDEQQTERCHVCGSVATSVTLLAGLVLGVFEPSPTRVQSPLVYASLRDASPDRRHAPPTAPPTHS